MTKQEALLTQLDYIKERISKMTEAELSRVTCEENIDYAPPDDYIDRFVATEYRFTLSYPIDRV